MKPFSIWAAITLIAFGALGGGYHLHLSAEPRRVAVVVDTSFPMRPVWRHVPRVLEEIGARRYAAFSLATEKGRVHGWSPRLAFGQALPYAPRDFSKLSDGSSFPEIGEASEVHLITNAGAPDTGIFGGWKIHRLSP